MVTRTPRTTAGKPAGRAVRKPAVAASVPPAEKLVKEVVEPVAKAAIAPAKPAPAPVPATPIAADPAPAPVPATPAALAVQASATAEELKQEVVKTATKAAASVAKVIDAAVPEAAAQSATKSVEQAVAYTKQVEKMSKQVFTAFDDVTGFHKENVDAFVASSTILAKGFESLSKEWLAFSQGQYEASVSTAKALLGVKSVKELVDLQTGYAKSSFDALLAEATKVSEAGFKVANEAAEPITARVNATVEKLSKIKAAA